ncbi:tetratricopeptide repeat-containing serine protease family protein [Desulfovibrio sp. TomC]|uniref:tetratricopeptide repeat-containing serine protease family protein n=1 Tax=Desulfovibrio sp. TomC TaxID=1562888 RepID=UPI0005750144|nr:tetratricopeptide repeat-containing serine protease family protein [Desulfovibrio sp. TomC]KHK03504.1 hypothetical protein NY78_1092 [Desulfovibrio sp. TomC]
MPGAGRFSRRFVQAVCGLGLMLGLGCWPGIVRADFDAALKAYEGGDDAAALRELKPLLSSGNPSAAWLMGCMVEGGRGVSADAALAARWYRKAAEAGNVPAMLSLADLHLRGQGVPQSDARAGDWLKKAAAKGSSRALLALGLLRLDGRLGPASDAPAYLRRAVAAGSGEAAVVLGELYLAGRIVPRDPGQAYRLALTAETAGAGRGPMQSRLAALTAAAQKELPPATAQSLRAGSDKAKTPSPPQSPPGQVRTGTGFVVSRLGHVLTNAHVASGCARIVAMVDGQAVGATVSRLDVAHDLALLKLAVAPSRVLSFREGSTVPPEVAVYAAGYPGERARTGEMRITSGHTRELAAGVGISGEVAISAEVLPGNSGGPLLDASGRVAGVVRARRDSEAVREQVGGGMADMGFAVPLAEVKAFLSRGQVPILTAPSGRTLDTAGLAQELSGTVLPLFCRPGR